MNTDQLFINGEFRDPHSEEKISVECPFTQKVIAQVPVADKRDLDLAVEGAVKAVHSGTRLSKEERISRVRKMVDFLKGQREAMARTVHLELGCPLSLAQKVHVDGYLANMDDDIRLAENFSQVQDHEHYQIQYEPVGVIGAITPWNYPVGQIAKKVIPALLAGCAVILKPSQRTPLSAYYFAYAAKEAGLPPGLFQLLPGRGRELGNLIAEHPLIDGVSFTGSTAGGREMMKTGGDTIKRLTLELGGKSPAILLPDSDYQTGIKKVLGTVFHNCGQTCSAWTRLIAPEKDRKRIEETVVEEAKKWTFGDPEKEGVRVGPLQSEKGLEKVKKYVALGKKEARLLYEAPVHEERGYFHGPVIFTDVDPYSPLAQEEIFGPVLVIHYYETVDEAVEIANATEYGLSAYVCGENAREVAGRIRSGEVIIDKGNSGHDAPFGGMKRSGFGREGGLPGLMEFYEIKTLHF